MLELGPSRRFVVELDRDAIVDRLRPSPMRESGPVKNLFALERTSAPDAFELLEEGDAVHVGWADHARPGLATVLLHPLEAGGTEVEIYPARVSVSPRDRGMRYAAYAAIALPLILQVSAINVLLVVGLIVLLILRERRGTRRTYAEQCDGVAEAVIGRIQPFVLPESGHSPYRLGS